MQSTDADIIKLVTNVTDITELSRIFHLLSHCQIDCSYRSLTIRDFNWSRRDTCADAATSGAERKQMVATNHQGGRGRPTVADNDCSGIREMNCGCS
ncbi:hypothetical protein L1887_00552 [Cichorium endivia]|nr:hypothetical protein L1887_00552 [Cichorium endivia]